MMQQEMTGANRTLTSTPKKCECKQGDHIRKLNQVVPL